MPQPRRPTIVDVAAAARVSKSLVSMVLRGDPGASPTSRQRVLAAARELGYRQNRAAAILAAGRTNTVGVAVDDYRNLWYVPFFSGVRDALAPFGVRVATADGSTNEHLALSPFDDLMSLRVDGIIVAAELPAGSGDDSDVPVVVVGSRTNPVVGADVVAGDEEHGARLVADHLTALGHRRIGHVAGSDGTGVRRRAGFVSSLVERGIDPVVIAGVDRVAVGRGAPDTTERDGFERTTRLLTEHPDVTAVFTANDTMAMGAFGAARRLGLRIPTDLSIIGYDDSPMASSALLDLTTVDARYADLGRIAAQRLLERIEDPAGASGRSTTLEPRLVERSSTGPVRV